MGLEGAPPFIFIIHSSFGQYVSLQVIVSLHSHSSFYLAIDVSIYLFINLSIYLIGLSIYRSIYLSIYFPRWWWSIFLYPAFHEKGWPWHCLCDLRRFFSPGELLTELIVNGFASHVIICMAYHMVLILRDHLRRISNSIQSFYFSMVLNFVIT